MANKHASLTALFTDIADAIREKTGDTGTIVADNFPTSIRNMKRGFPNGTEWTKLANRTYTYGALYREGLYVVCGTSSGNNKGIYYSEDGKNWTASNITSVNIKHLMYVDGLWVAAGAGIFYSNDGKNWTESNITGINGINQLSYQAGKWTVCCYGNTKGFYYSNDGKNWIASYTSSAMNVHYADGLWVLSSNSNISIKYSTDLTNWYNGNLDFSLCSVDFAKGIWIMNDSNKGIYYSEDGKNWTASNMTSKGRRCTHFSNGLWVASKHTGLCYSEDGKTWTDATGTGDKPFDIICNSNGIWLAAGNGSCIYSLDGKVWKKSNLPGFTFSISVNNGFLLATSSEGLYVSTTWEPEQ